MSALKPSAPDVSDLDALLDRAEHSALCDLRRTLVCAGERLATASCVRQAARAHPLLAAVSAVAAGFCLAPVLVAAVGSSGAANAASRSLGKLPPAFRRQLLHAVLRSTGASP